MVQGKDTYGWMERGSLYVGKNLKNHWRAQRKWGREKTERRAKPGEEPRKEEKLKNEQEKKIMRGVNKNSSCMRETGEGNKTNAW